MTDRSKYSFTRVILAGFYGITLSMALVLGWLIYRSQAYSEYLAQNEFRSHVSHITTVLSVEVTSRQKLAHQISHNPELPNLLSFGDPLEIEAWTLRTRELIPDIVGLAIFDQAGDLYGNGGSQRVGPRCQADIRKLVSEVPSPTLPFHGETDNLRHFDIVVPIDIQGIRRNFLLISFHTSLLEKRIRQMMGPDSSYVLSNSNGEELVDIGSARGDGAFRYRQAVPNSDWVLEMSSNLTGNTEFSRQSWGIFSLVALGTFVVVSFITLRLRQRLEEDMQILKKQMGMIHESDFDGTIKLETPYFRETEELNQFINTQSKNIIKLTSELEKEARHDPLTGLFNRRALDESESRWLSLAHRGFNISILLVDLDGFKKINDVLGHELGDAVLVEFAESLRAIVRLSDECFRFGGDEFVVIQVDMTAQNMQQWFEKLQAAVALIASKLTPPENTELRLGVSAGCAWITAEDESIKAVIQRADIALYNAKGSGRGRLMVSSDVE